MSSEAAELGGRAGPAWAAYCDRGWPASGTKPTYSYLLTTSLNIHGNTSLQKSPKRETTTRTTIEMTPTVTTDTRGDPTS